MEKSAVFRQKNCNIVHDLFFATADPKDSLHLVHESLNYFASMPRHMPDSKLSIKKMYIHNTN